MNRIAWPLAIALWALIVSVIGWIRPMIPSNELHYASVAWEMWTQHSFLVPLEAGMPYPEKSPLLFWLIHFGWLLFGVSSMWIRLLPQLFVLGTLWLTRILAKKMWPAQRQVANIAPLIVLGSLVWSLQLQVTWFDLLISFFAMASWCVLYHAAQQEQKRYWLFLAVITGLGILAKGPVILLFLLPPALTMPYWSKPSSLSWGIQYRRLCWAIAAAILIGLAWALPAAHFAGSAYAHNIFLGQSIGRISGAHGSVSWYYYLLIAPMLLLPWCLWPPAWRAVFKLKITANIRFLLWVIVPPLFILSCFAGKLSSYIVPLLPPTAILLSTALVSSAPSRQFITRWLMLFFCVAIGGAYLFLVYFAPEKLTHKYFWLPELSPLWGWAMIILGVLWSFCRSTKLFVAVMGVSIISVLISIFLQMSVMHVQAKHNDWRPLAQQISVAQQQELPIVFANDPPEVLFEFFGQLNAPIMIPKNFLSAWLQMHPNGLVIIRDKKTSPSQFRWLQLTDIHTNTLAQKHPPSLCLWTR